MYQTSEKFGELIQQSSRSLIRSKLIVDGKTEITEGIKSVKLSATSNSDSTFTIGSVPAQYIELTLLCPPVALENHELEWLIGLEVGGKYEYVPMGIYTAEKPETNEGSTKVICYDRMMKTEMAYFSSLSESTTTKAVLTEIGESIKVPVRTDGIASYPMKKPVGYTYREVLSYISQMYAGFAVCNRMGQIEIKQLAPVNYFIRPDRYWDSFVHNDFPYDFLKISCITGKGENGENYAISCGSGVREMTVSNPFMTQEQLTHVYEMLKGFSYMPGQLKLLGDPRLDPWDIVTVIGTDKSSYKVPLMKLVHTYDGGLTTEIEAYGESETESEQSFKGPVTNALERYAVSLALVEHAIVKKLDVDTANITYAKIKDLDAINAIIQNLDATFAKIQDLTAINAHIDNLNVSYGNIETLLSGNAGVGNLTNIHLTSENAVIDSALIKSLISQNITVNDLMAGILYTDKIQIWNNVTGGMKLSGSTMQWTDKNAVVRMQAGLDSNDTFNFYISDDAGKIMWNALGLTGDAIKSPIIKDSMVTDDANIAGSKININSVVSELNKDGTTSIKGTKIYLDEKNQNLTIAFTKMEEGNAKMSTDVSNIQVDADGIRASISNLSDKINGIQINNLVYATRYQDSPDGMTTIYAAVYSSGKEVTLEYPFNWFSWTRKSEDTEKDALFAREYGRSIIVDRKESGLGGSVFVGHFITRKTSYLVGKNGNRILTKGGSAILLTGKE